GFNLKEGRFRLEARKTFFTIRVMKHWNRLPSGVVGVSTLDVSKTRLDGALSNMV
ncbi:hypothetical protein N331_03205, partial [Merops nubicus]